MNDSIYRISLDIHEHGSQAVVKAKNTDTGRKLYISLREGSASYIIAEDCYAVFKATKPDGSILYNACTIEGNEIIYEFTKQTCTSVGRCRCEIALYGLDDKLITSPRFTLLVDGTIYPDETVESTDEFSALTQMVTDGMEATEAATQAAQRASEAAGVAGESAVRANESSNKADVATQNANVATQNANNSTETANKAAEMATQAAQSASNATENANGASDRANKATEAANNAADIAAQTAIKAAQTAKSLMVIGKTEGTAIHLDDAIDQYLVGCRIFGKTTQDGTPTPDAPVDLVSSADGNHLSVHVCSKNLFSGWIVGGINPSSGTDYVVDTQRRTQYIPISSPGQKYSISKIPSTLYSFVAFYDADKNFIKRSAAAPHGGMLVEPPENAKYFRLTSYENAEVTGKIAEADAMAASTMIEIGEIATEYERGKQVQTATVSSLNGLRGIPVISGGNYTDENGQQWICDEIDFDRGVYVKRTETITFTGTEGWIGYFTDSVNQFHTALSSSFHRENECGAMCANYKPIAFKERSNNYGTVYTYDGGIAFNTTECSSIDDWKALLATRPTTVLYALVTPVETPLSEGELAAFDVLRTHRQDTTVCNDGFAHMELEYVMDAKKYIDRVMAGAVAKIGEVTLPASAWKGADSLYSQIATIDGVTPYSKVDLLPSVEQLAIFHNKDVTFVTENEDGVVTVFAIGDKPTQNYTMQIQITEVGA